MLRVSRGVKKRLLVKTVKPTTAAFFYWSTSLHHLKKKTQGIGRGIGLGPYQFEPSVSSTSDEESHFDTDSLEENDNEERLQGLHW